MYYQGLRLLSLHVTLNLQLVTEVIATSRHPQLQKGTGPICNSGCLRVDTTSIATIRTMGPMPQLGQNLLNQLTKIWYTVSTNKNARISQTGRNFAKSLAIAAGGEDQVGHEQQCQLDADSWAQYSTSCHNPDCLTVRKTYHSSRQVTIDNETGLGMRRSTSAFRT